MQIVVGLGNPGKEYQSSRHNVGFMVLEALATKVGAPDFQVADKFQAETARAGRETWLVKPQTFMNDSGRAVHSLLTFYKEMPDHDGRFSQVLVVHDDLDIPLGSFKVQMGTGPKIHNGLLSLYQHLGTEQFWHVRVGVDNRGGDRSLPGHEYVLQTFRPDEREVLKGVIDQVVNRLESELHL